MSSIASAEQPSPHPAAQKFRDRYGDQKQKPFRDGQAMIGPPDCSWASFKRPLLKAFPWSQQEIVWHCKLGYGVDGTVWKVEIDGRFYALKVVSPSSTLSRAEAYLMILPVLGQQAAGGHALLGRPERMPKRRLAANDSNGRREINRTHIPQGKADIVERCCPKPSRVLHRGQPRVQVSTCS